MHQSRSAAISSALLSIAHSVDHHPPLWRQRRRPRNAGIAVPFATDLVTACQFFWPYVSVALTVGHKQASIQCLFIGFFFLLCPVFFAPYSPTRDPSGRPNGPSSSNPEAGLFVYCSPSNPSSRQGPRSAYALTKRMSCLLMQVRPLRVDAVTEKLPCLWTSPILLPVVCCRHAQLTGEAMTGEQMLRHCCYKQSCRWSCACSVHEL